MRFGLEFLGTYTLSKNCSLGITAWLGYHFYAIQACLCMLVANIEEKKNLSLKPLAIILCKNFFRKYLQSNSKFFFI